MIFLSHWIAPYDTKFPYFFVLKLSGILSFSFLSILASISLSSSLSTLIILVCQIPCWLLWLSASYPFSWVSSRGSSDTDPSRLDRPCVGLEDSLNAEPDRELLVAEREFLDLKALWKNGRRVGIQAATMTTFCSTLDAED